MPCLSLLELSLSLPSFVSSLFSQPSPCPFLPPSLALFETFKGSPMQTQVYSPVRIESKRSNSDSAGSNSSYSTSTSSSSVPSPDEEETDDPFGLEFSLTHLALKDAPQEYFPTQPMSFVLPSMARTPKSAGGRRMAGPGGEEEEEEEEEEGRGWEPEEEGATPRLEAPPSLLAYTLNSASTTPSIETAPRPSLSPTTIEEEGVVNSSSSNEVSTTPIDPPPNDPIPLPALHLIPRPPPTPAQRKYSSSLLSATQRLLEISLSPNPSPSDPTSSSCSYFPVPIITDNITRNPLQGSDWSPALSVSPSNSRGGGPNEDGAFALEDEGSYERRFSRLRREADARTEALRALREEAGAENWEDEGVEEWEHGEVVVEEDGTSAPPFWDDEEDEGGHHVEYSGYP
ncbi:hypothetical protein BDY24DRAFT_657 [Mrakia frigida]|uniref:uncharacterized protein n=1 Tax=Mrakia frigida TaxID=29902 RepID=UPI003FCC0D27